MSVVPNGIPHGARSYDALFAFFSKKPVFYGLGDIQPYGTYPVDDRFPEYVTLMFVPAGVVIDDIYKAFEEYHVFSHKFLSVCHYGGAQQNG